MSLPASLSIRDLLWIAIPGILIVILFAPAIGLHLQGSDLALIILGGVVIGYVVVDLLGMVLDRIYRAYDRSKKRFSSRYREASKKLLDEEKKWDFGKVHSKLKKEEEQGLSELDGYKHLHGYMSIIFLLYSAYNLSIVLRFGIGSNNTILTFDLPAVFLALTSALAAILTWESFLKYSEIIRRRYLRYAARQTDPIPPSP